MQKINKHMVIVFLYNQGFSISYLGQRFKYPKSKIEKILKNESKIKELINSNLVDKYMNNIDLSGV